MAKQSEAFKKLLKERPSEVAQKSKENKAYRAGEAGGTHDLYKEAEKPIRKTEGARYQGLDTAGALKNIIKSPKSTRKIEDTLRKSGAY